MAVKEKEELEFPEVLPPPGRDQLSDFRVGDEVMANWDDGDQYEAVILNIDGQMT